jgi:hypothetical protein
VTALRQRDIEHCFWKHGCEQVFAAAADFGELIRPFLVFAERLIVEVAPLRSESPAV